MVGAGDTNSEIGEDESIGSISVSQSNFTTNRMQLGFPTAYRLHDAALRHAKGEVDAALPEQELEASHDTTDSVSQSPRAGNHANAISFFAGNDQGSPRGSVVRRADIMERNDSVTNSNVNLTASHSPHSPAEEPEQIQREARARRFSSVTQDSNEAFAVEPFPTSPFVRRVLGNCDVSSPLTRDQLQRNWETRRSTVSPSVFRKKSPAELLEFWESARRRATRFSIGEQVRRPVPPQLDEWSPESPRHQSFSGDNNNGLREELDRCRRDILQMADMGAALLVDLEDQKNLYVESEAEREKLEHQADKLTETCNVFKKQNNELKLLLTTLRQDLEDSKIEHAQERSTLLSSLERHQNPDESLLNDTATQAASVHALRRAHLAAGRMEAAQALFRIGHTEPQVVEVQNRVHIEQQMWGERCDILWQMAERAHSGWTEECNAVELRRINIVALRKQLIGINEARVRAEHMATQQQELHDDTRRQLAQRNLTIHRLQNEVMSRSVQKMSAEDLAPTVSLALQKVHALKQKCIAFEARVPLRDCLPKMVPATTTPPSPPSSQKAVG